MDQLQAARGLPPRRLSSTPIKSPPKAAPQRSCSVGSRGCLAVKSGATNSEVFVVKIRDDGLKNKPSVYSDTSSDSRRENNRVNSDVSSCGSSDFDDLRVAVKPPSLPSILSFPATSNLPYDKRSYQDEDSCRDSDVTQVDEGESDSVLSAADESTLMEDGDERGRVVFDDNDTWNNLEDTAVSSANESRGVSPVSRATAGRVSPPERTLQRKVAASKAAETERVIGSANQEADPAPASQLMTKLFPSLKPKTQNAPLPPPAAAPESKKSDEETGEEETHFQSLKHHRAEVETNFPPT